MGVRFPLGPYYLYRNVLKLTIYLSLMASRSKVNENGHDEVRSNGRIKYSREVVKEVFEYGLDVSTRTVYLSQVLDSLTNDGEINSITSANFIKGVRILNSINSKPIRAVLSSPGGSVTDGWGIYDAIKHSRAPVDIEVYGEAQSMAAIILQAGNKRLLHPYAVLMLHDGTPWHCGSTARDGEAWAEWGKKDRERTYALFARRTRKPTEYWRD